ncbi:hypothetical protein, partial [Rheinheimera pleomorphica]|uniref:hypothetical protein n=4 Tax=Rheinheimera pleomorphica TaxID=2703963 RepID=UPI002B25361B
MLRSVVILSMVVLLQMVALPASASVKTAIDIYSVQLEALGSAANQSSRQVADNARGTIRALYDIVDQEIGYDVNDPGMLIRTVDAIYYNDVFASRAGLATSLLGISTTIQSAEQMQHIIGLASQVQNIGKVAAQLHAITKDPLVLTDALVLRNSLVDLASGNRNSVYELDNQLTVIRSKVSKVNELADFIAALYNLGPETLEAYQHAQAAVAILRSLYAQEQANDIASGQWAKLVIQDIIVDIWQREKGLTAANLHNMRAYRRETTPCAIFVLVGCPAVLEVSAAMVYPADSQDTPVQSSFNLNLVRSPVVDRPNTFIVHLPDDVADGSRFGQVDAVEFWLDGKALFAHYAANVSGVLAVDGSTDHTKVKTFVFNLQPYQQSMLVSARVSTKDGKKHFADDLLVFEPRLSALTVLDVPAEIAQQPLHFTVHACGDTLHSGYVLLKNPGMSWTYTSVSFNGYQQISGDCKAYNVSLAVRDVLNKVSANQTVELAFTAAELTSATTSLYVVDAFDTDNDGLPDDWEHRYFNDLSMLASDDPDNDGFTNLQELLQGTDPSLAGLAGVTEIIDIRLSEFGFCYFSGHFSAHVKLGCVAELTSDTTIYGDLYLASSLNLNGFTLTVEGDLIQSAGVLQINEGQVKVAGDYRLQQRLETEGYAESTGQLVMTYDADYVLVQGDFVMQSRSSHDGQLTAGVLEVKGDFTQLRASYAESLMNFLSTDTHKVLLSGQGQQVSFASGGAGSSRSRFATLELAEGSGSSVRFVTPMVALRLVSHGQALQPFMLGLNWTLERDEVIQGNYHLAGGEINLAGHSLTIKGELLHSAGIMRLGGGRLLVEGDYRLQQRLETEGYAESTGQLVMTNDADYVLVQGDFVMQSRSSHDGQLTAGVLEVKGDFTQLRASYAESLMNFLSTDTHKVLLSGQGQQVSFASGGAGSS